MARLAVHRSVRQRRRAIQDIEPRDARGGVVDLRPEARRRASLIQAMRDGRSVVQREGPAAGAGSAEAAKQPEEDPAPRLVLQIPITPANFQIPVGGQGGIDVAPKDGRSAALDQGWQPNIAAGLNYAFTPDPTGFQLGAFVQAGVNVPLRSGADRPLDSQRRQSSFTGLTVQGYLQPSYVVFNWTSEKKRSTSIALFSQAGVGRTYLSDVPGVNGLSVNLQGGVQFTQDLVANKLQLVGSLAIGGATAQPDQQGPGSAAWQPWQQFFGVSIGLQPVVTLVNYKKK